MDKQPATKSLLPNDFRLLIAILFCVGLAVYFWLTSRYPALNEKALMGGDTPVMGLSFDIIYEILPQSGLIWEIIANTANWIDTNKKGMTFGVLFGAAALTLLGLVEKRSFKGGFANSAFGALIGAPLGVCVNCAMPISMGLHAGRMRLETTLSALFASPTLNVVVVTMAFTLLPFTVAVIKIVISLVLVLLVVPLLCKYILKKETAEGGDRFSTTMSDLNRVSAPKGLTTWLVSKLAPKDVLPGRYGPFPALVWFAKTYGRNLFFLALITVPMMLVAGFLGALVTAFVSPVEFATFLPNQNDGLLWMLIAMILVVAVASFMPAPIAFDVILTVILFNIGLAPHYGAAILIALGSFSIYSFIVLWQLISRRTALVLWVAICALAIAAGLTQYALRPVLSAQYFDQKVRALGAVGGIEFPSPEPLLPGADISDLRETLAAQSARLISVDAIIETTAASDVEISLLDFANVRRSPAPVPRAEAQFSRILGTEIGIEEKGVLTPLRTFGYYQIEGAMAAGDIHADGWPDLIVQRPMHADGLSIYANIAGRFQRQAVDLGPVEDRRVMNLALADLNNDGALDLFVSTLLGGDYIFYNQGGTYSKTAMTILREDGHASMVAVGFGDLDKDGDVDIVAGNWGPAGVREVWGQRPLHLRNEIFWNNGNGQFEPEIIEPLGGTTLSLLLSDIDNNGYLDILKGDDSTPTDEVIFFGQNGIKPRDKASQPFPYYTFSSMSYDSGDWNNDLRLDYYGGQTSFANGDGVQVAAMDLKRDRGVVPVCEQYSADLDWSSDEILQCIGDLASTSRIFGPNNGRGQDGCTGPDTAEHRALCAAGFFVRYNDRLSGRNPNGNPERYEDCVARLKHIPEMQEMCLSILEPTTAEKPVDIQNALFQPAFVNGNILMTATDDGAFSDEALMQGVRFPGWTWSSKFYDYDQDGWQDLFVVNGIWRNAQLSRPNKFYSNDAGSFSDQTESSGLGDMTPSYAFLSFDYDRDGDLDIIRDNSGLRMIVHRNEATAGAGLIVQLDDWIGDRFGIGARVTICTNGELDIRPGNCQLREIKASGGFMSADPIQAHFGLGTAEKVSLVQIDWLDGETTRIKPEDVKGGVVKVSRRSGE